MLELLKNLFKLQQIDNELSILERKKQEIPKKIEGLQLLTENKKNELNTLQQNIVELKKKYKLLEVDLKEAEDKINNYSMQLYSAKTNEQYKAFLKEIENQKKEKNSIEDKMIDIMEQIEIYEKEIKKLNNELIEIEQDTQNKINLIKNDQKNVLKAINDRIKQREFLCQQIGQETVSIYEKIRKGKNGIAVVKIDDVRCQGCLNPLPPQKILEIMKNERIHFCEYCGRITIAPNIENNNSS
ncbi:MAG: C4-type zinc ribbon domain-containing protein [candidate division WOR-3 bacterium]